MFDPTRLVACAALLGHSVRAALRWTSYHTGLPAVFVASIALVGSWRLFKQSLRFVVEVAFAAALLLVATKLGLLSW